APPPAKNTYTTSGLSDAISVRNGWNSTLGNGSVISFTTLPPPFSNVSLNPPVDSDPAAYFQVSVTAVFAPFSAATLPIASPGCEFENDVRKMFGAHIGPVIASAPALGMIKSVLLSRAALAMASATPEWTVPTTTSTLSRLISLFTLSGAFAGSDSSSTVMYSISRPPNLPPASFSASLKPLVIAVPSAAYVPVYGSISPTLIFCCASTGGAASNAAVAQSAATACKRKT